MMTVSPSCSQRGGAAAHLVTDPIFYSLKTCYGIVATIFEGLSNGSCYEDAGYDLKRNCKNLTASLAQHSICIVNPHAGFQAQAPLSINHTATEWISSCSFSLYRRHDDWVSKHLFSRIALFGTLLVSLVTRVIDLAIGVLAFPCALITLGKYEWLNAQSLQGFAAIGLCVSDVVLGIVNIIHPNLHIDKRMSCGYHTID